MRTLVNFFALAMAVVVDASEKPEELVWGANMYSSAGTFVQGPARPLLNHGTNPTAKAAVVADALSGGGYAMAGAWSSIGMAVKVSVIPKLLRKQQQMWKQINVSGV
jgi:hypothetical protein